jgi:hypothetical protein
MPKCQGCFKGQSKLLRHPKYGNLCSQCARIVDDFVILKIRLDRASKVTRRQIYLQLKKLANELRHRQQRAKKL